MTYPYHENANTGEMVPCSSNPCRLHSAEQHYMADNAEEAMQMKMERKGIAASGGLKSSKDTTDNPYTFINNKGKEDFASPNSINYMARTETNPKNLALAYEAFHKDIMERKAHNERLRHQASDKVVLYNFAINPAISDDTVRAMVQDVPVNSAEAFAVVGGLTRNKNVSIRSIVENLPSHAMSRPTAQGLLQRGKDLTTDDTKLYSR